MKLDEHVSFTLKDHLKRQCVLCFRRSGDNQQHFIPAKKRGNKAYNYFLYQRFKDIEYNIKSLVNITERQSNALMLTLTYPTTPDKSSWERYKTDNKIFFDRLRKSRVLSRYGKFNYLNVIESTKNGELHCHVLIIFERPFIYSKSKRKDGRDFGLIADSTARNEIKNAWHSISDVCAVYSTGGAVSYVQKYYLKQFSHLELLLKKDDNGTLDQEEVKALLCLYHVIKNNMRMFRASRAVSKAGTAEADSLVDILNNYETKTPERWEMLGIQPYWTFRNAVLEKTGLDFHLMNGVVIDDSGFFKSFEYNAYYYQAHLRGDIA